MEEIIQAARDDIDNLNTFKFQTATVWSATHQKFIKGRYNYESA